VSTDSLATVAAAGFDLAHAFDANAIAREPGLGWLAGRERCGILIGNTRALWPPFTAAMREPALAAQADPLERYTEATITGDRVYYAHRQYDGAYLPFQRVAVATGLGALSEGGLVIHPLYGPWFALRAILLTDDEPVARVPIAKPCVCDARCGAAVATALASRDWRPWLAVRDACSLRDFRYSERQISFHYTKAWEREWGAPSPIASGNQAPDR
jgi:hypothetical protein